MTGIIKVNELQGRTTAGNITVTSEGGAVTMQLQQGLAKVLEKHDASHNVDNSMNVSTLTDEGNGDTTVNYTNSTTNIHQYVVAGAGNNSTQNRLIQNIATETHTTSSHRYKVSNSNFTGTDTAINNSVVYGELA